MVDSGATSCFVDTQFVSRHGLTPRRKMHAETLHVVDGRESAAGMVTHEIPMTLAYRGHVENMLFQITTLAEYPIILGKSWLEAHEPRISWSQNLLELPPRDTTRFPSRSTIPTTRQSLTSIRTISASSTKANASSTTDAIYDTNTRTILTFFDPPNMDPPTSTDPGEVPSHSAAAIF
ncbi:hypothetical protein BROUX41_000052 [Berkeleyomyces rouxiae]|uniref:uncharacterized protein n=1 Tax=Berkeleyomyces rouxiae TaxID=2035830 RepID=UPI003B781ED4